MANVELSDEEWKVLSNADFLLTKNAVIQKIMQAFSLLAEQYQDIVKWDASNWKEQVYISPKISKGEQYEGLPYLMLDYPRQFGKENIFAIRSFFWWGHYFSINLLVKGVYQEKLLPILADTNLQDWSIDQSETPWSHHPDKNKCLLLKSWQNTESKQMPFLKLFKQLPINEWQKMEVFFLTSFSEIWQAISFQDDGINPLPDGPTSKNRP